MRTAPWLLATVIIGGCGSKDSAGTGSAAPPPPPPPPAAAPALELVRCAAAMQPPLAVGAGFGLGGSIGHGSGTGLDIGGGPHRGKPVTVGGPEGSGVDREAIRREVKHNVNAIQACYEKELVTKPKLEGTVRAHFSIGGDGKVMSSTAEGVDPGVAKCVAAVVAKLKFPKTGIVTAVNYPFIFRVADGAAGPTSGPPPAALPPAGTHGTSATDRTAVKEFGMVGLLGQGNTLGQAFEQWSPYAQWGSRLPDEQIAAASTALAAAVKAKLPELEHCLAGAGATGSIRAMFAFEPDGAAKLVRVGGLGDDPIERCLAGALRATKLPPQSAAFELACDLSRGGERPWRVTPSAGYDVITVKHDGAEHDGAGLDHAAEHPISKDHAVLIIAEPDAPAVALAAAVNAARRAPSTLVAVRADNVQVYTALVAVLEFGANRVLELAANDGTVRVVHGDAGLPAASPTDAKMLDQLLAAAKPTCPPSECTVQIDLGEHVGPNELFAIASAARRGGYDRVGVSSQASGTGDPVR